jgi:hypothetical protein
MWFPPTIEDAISGSLELGFKYLWIDRYCIDQDNDQEVAHQITNMNTI